jgi:hypothetical protein
MTHLQYLQIFMSLDMPGRLGTVPHHTGVSKTLLNRGTGIVP